VAVRAFVRTIGGADALAARAAAAAAAADASAADAVTSSVPAPPPSSAPVLSTPSTSAATRRRNCGRRCPVGVAIAATLGRYSRSAVAALAASGGHARALAHIRAPTLVV
jgi:hypothetical protein